MICRGGRTNYGEAIGILMLNTGFPRIPGDIGSAATFSFPVLYETVECATVARIVAKQADPELLEPFVEGGMELVRRGARAVTTSCGFLAICQKELAAALPVPVFTSALLQIPMIRRMLSPGQKIGVITADASKLGAGHFAGAGADPADLVVCGIEDTYLGDVFLRDGRELDAGRGHEIMGRLARRIAAEHPEVGAIVLECTNLPPFADTVRRESGLPVYDIITLTELVHRGFAGVPFRNHI